MWSVGVSTHSRPNAAGRVGDCNHAREHGFNSQPPEGGWAHVEAALQGRSVSTHSRPKAAGLILLHACCFYSVSTHSRPKAAGMHLQLFCRYCRFQLTAARRRLECICNYFADIVGFNSQPPEGGWRSHPVSVTEFMVSTHSRPKAAGPKHGATSSPLWFQLTAARRRLVWPWRHLGAGIMFQLTAARRRLVDSDGLIEIKCPFQLTAARRRLAPR